jgi:hypothetical protein
MSVTEVFIEFEKSTRPFESIEGQYNNFDYANLFSDKIFFEKAKKMIYSLQ